MRTMAWGHAASASASALFPWLLVTLPLVRVCSIATPEFNVVEAVHGEAIAAWVVALEVVVANQPQWSSRRTIAL